MMENCPFSTYFDQYSPECCKLYKKNEKVCIFESIDNKLSAVLNFQQTFAEFDKRY